MNPTQRFVLIILVSEGVVFWSVLTISASSYSLNTSRVDLRVPLRTVGSSEENEHDSEYVKIIYRYKLTHEE